MNKKTWLSAFTAAFFVLVAYGCAQDPPTELGDEDPSLDSSNGSNPNSPGGPRTGGDPGNTFDHPGDLGTGATPATKNPQEGPPAVAARLHSCSKLRNDALRNLLESFGVDMNANDDESAGRLFRSSIDTLGGAQFDARVGEAVRCSTSCAVKIQDIFVQAANEIISNIENQEACKIGGVGVKMFDDQDNCNIDAITCLMGYPATKEHVELCNQAVKSLSDKNQGKRLAVSALLSAAHSCE